LVSKKGYKAVGNRQKELENRKKEVVNKLNKHQKRFRKFVKEMIVSFTFGKFKQQLLSMVNADINKIEADIRHVNDVKRSLEVTIRKKHPDKQDVDIKDIVDDVNVIMKL
jgi:hypothetical protein